MEEYRIISRAEQKTEDTWNMEDLYASEDLYDKDREKTERMMERFSSFQGRLSRGPKELLETLRLYEKMNRTFEKLYVYANQKYHEDTANAKYQKMSQEAQLLGTRLSQCTAWLEPELLTLPEEKLGSYFGACEAANAAGQTAEADALSMYKRFIEQITRRKEHVLNADTEALLSKAGDLGQAPSNIFSMFNNADIRFPDVCGSDGKALPLTQGSYISMLQKEDRTLRRNAFQSLYSVYAQFENTLAAVYYANARQADFFAKEHHYASSMEEALDINEIPVSVYHSLIETINRRLPLMHRYMELRKRLMGLDELHMYDIYTPMVRCPQKTYSFEEAKEIVRRGLAPLGEDYLAILQEGFDNRWIDVYENTGKRTGAYSWGAYEPHPYVLLNFHGGLKDVFTLAHEMGHSLHSWYSNHTQPYLYAGYRIFVAEVASTCNEALLIHDLMERSTDEDEKKYLINYFLEQFRTTMYRQTMFAEFEMLTHQAVQRGEALTAETLNQCYLELNQRYFGSNMVVDEEISHEWSRIPHFYNPFYVYQYATGFAAAIAISSKILSNESGIVEKYKRFLSGGSSKNPIDLLKICGVDMSTPEPVEAALDVFEQYLSKME